MTSDLARVRAALDAAVVGHDGAKTALLLGWLARVHVLLEGPPGCGKSALASALASALGAPSTLASLAEGSVLHRTRDGALERIHLERAPLVCAPICVLDDVERASEVAPGLLASLDRDDGPFLVATRGANALHDPLPALAALLERCVLRVRMRGMIAAWRENEVRALLAHTPAGDAAEAVGPESAAELRTRTAGIPIPEDVLDAASRWISTCADARVAHALPRLLRAHALLRGGERVERADLHALAALLAPVGEASAVSDAPAHDALASVAAPGIARDAGDGAGQGDAERSRTPAALERALSAASAVPVTSEAGAVEALVAALAGRWGRGRGERHPDASGAPRRRRPLRDLSESTDADPAELLAYLGAESAERPAVLQRERRGASPALLILRDVSASMQGPGARWSLRLVRALVDAARAERMRVGYLEFNHLAERFTLRGRFVHRAYAALCARAAQALCAGRTSYQAALDAALCARVPRGECDVVMISDGVPVVGDPAVQAERRRARRRGWKLHTVFVGLPPVPPVLAELARETGGLAFCVAPTPSRVAASAPAWSLRQLGGHGR